MSELQALEQALRAAAAAVGRDARHLFVRLGAETSGGILAECSDAASLAAALPRLQELAGGRPLRGVVLPAADLRGRAAWVAASVAEVRRRPEHACEQVTQALQGEALEPLLHEEGWVLARLADGYVGWVRDWHLRLVEAREPAAFAARAAVRVAKTWGPVWSEPRAGAEPCAETILGTRAARGRQSGGWSEIELPGGRRGWLPDAELFSDREPWPRAAAAIVATLRLFLGVPYMWGGKSPKGFDCSGLVQFAFGLHGVDLPRDSDQQASCGEPLPHPPAAADLAPGDLLFFGKERVTHVAVSLGGGDYLHARGEVRCNSLVSGSRLHDAELGALLLGARRVLPQGA